ncbi:protein SOSEKI 2 [Silene latifolia]|uniref:protein SOSEKI 2 n=1 Tax=Silene latifolia TaxID=37657 RepID=UPI003D77B710
MEVIKGRRSTERLLETKVISPEGAKLAANAYNCNEQPGHNNSHLQHPKNRIMKMFNKVQVVYYLTRNGHLEHPHYIEVSHLATQPLRLRDVIERLAILRGKAMPCQYSWSCKRSYKNGYVWNDMTENDAIYASEGSEYVLKGSELMQDRDFSEIRFEEFEKKGRKQNKSNNNAKSESNELMSSKGLQRRSFQQHSSNQVEQQDDRKYGQNVKSNEYETEEEEKRVSCNSSNAYYSKPLIDDSQMIMQVEQEESYSIPSTSSTISDKPAQQEKPSVLTREDQTKQNPGFESKRFEESMVIEEDGDPHSTALTRNPVLLQLIACGGAKPKGISKGEHKTNNFNFNMRNTLIPCLKQQLSTRVSMRNNLISKREGDGTTCGCKLEKSEVESRSKKEVLDDQDMIMLRYMSENPRFGNLQSQEKEYFSGTIVETMNHHHAQSFSSESGFDQGHPLTFGKSSSYNELRSAKAGLEAVASKAMGENEDESVKAKGMIKLCLPRKKNYPSNLSKSNKL